MHIKNKLFIPILYLTMGLSIGFSGSAQANTQDVLSFAPPAPDAYLSLNTVKSEWQFLLKQKPVKKSFQMFTKSLSTAVNEGFGLNWNKDIQPMLGGHMGLSVYRSAFSPKEKMPVLAVFDLKKSSHFSKMIQKMRVSSKNDPQHHLVERTYKGVTLYGLGHKENEPGIPYLAQSKNTLLVGGRALLEKSIDASLSHQNLLRDAAFQKVNKALKHEKLWVYLNPKKMKGMVNALPGLSKKRSKQTMKELNSVFNMYQGVGLGIDIQPHGLTIKTLVHFDPHFLKSPKYSAFKQALNSTKSAPSLSPLFKATAKRPLFFMAAQGLQWGEEGGNIFFPSVAPADKSFKKIIHSFEKFTHLNFKRDVLPYTDGRYGVGVFYSDKMKVYDQAPMAVAYLGINNNKVFAQHLKKALTVDFKAFEMPNAKGKVSRSKEVLHFPKKPSKTYLGVPLYMAQKNATLKSLKRELNIHPGYAHVDKIWVFGSNQVALKQAIRHLKGRGKNLSHNPRLKSLLKKFQIQQNLGLIFIDLSKVADVISYYLGDDEEVHALLPSLKAFRSVLAGGHLSGDNLEGVMHVDVDLNKVNFDLIMRWLS